MDIIVRGEPQEIDFVQRICRDKVRRGLLSFHPATGPVFHPCDDSKNFEDADSKYVVTDTAKGKAASAKKRSKKRTKKSE